MIIKFFIRFYQILEVIKSHGISYLLHELIFFNREAVPVVKELFDLKSPLNYIFESDITFNEISSDNKDMKLIFPLKSRYYKMLMRLNKGYTVFVIMRGNEVIGDVSGTNPEISSSGKYHSDLKKLDIKLKEKEVYMFDLFLNPDVRGGATANFLMSSAMLSLKNQGIIKVYGYYMTNNYPALWLHKMLKFKELNRVIIQRFLFIERSIKKIRK
jgi:hypothetical protein